MPTDNVKYPLLSGDDVTQAECVVCKRRCGEPGEFLMLSAGAILHDDATRMNGGPDDLMSGFLTLIKHGVEPDGSFTRLELMSDLIGGQGDVLLCSGTCLRTLFSAAIDELERRWQDDESRAR